MDNKDKKKNIDDETLVPKPKRKLWTEIIITGGIILAVTLLMSLFVSLFANKDEIKNMVEITYSKDKAIGFEKNFGVACLVFGFFLNALNLTLFFLLKPSGIKPDIGNKGKWLVCMIILGLFGYLAYLVIGILLAGWGLVPFPAALITGLIVSVYDYLIYKLYMEGRTFSNRLFWEFFRFAIVGLVAGIFDFLTCFLVQFVFFKGNEAGYVTVVATICGFIIGVIINYLMSTYMVYKASKSKFSKSIGGVVVFVVLSAIGLGMGIGIQYVLYDFLFLKKGVSFFSYPIDFVIRTLVVMVYNYITRKVIIYRS